MNHDPADPLDRQTLKYGGLLFPIIWLLGAASVYVATKLFPAWTW